MNSRRKMALQKLDIHFSKQKYTSGTRLPPERDLCSLLNISRSALREAFEVLEADGQIWRRVGMGTYFGGPPENIDAKTLQLSSLTSPSEIMEARILIEPIIARFAATKATHEEIVRMNYCLEKSSNVNDEQTHEKWDRTLHMTIVKATKNQILISFFKAINKIRSQTDWSELGDRVFTPARIIEYHKQHKAVINAIAKRSPEQAEKLMKEHLEAVKISIMTAETELAK